MPYEPINKCLSTSEDIRLQHRNSALAAELARTTHFDRVEVHRLLQLYDALTTKRGVTMDRRRFVAFMDVYLGVRNVDAMDRLHRLRCRAGRQYMTDREFVELLSLVLAGSLPRLVHLCFEVYTEVVRSPLYVRKEDVLAMARRTGGGGGEMTDSDQVYADRVMRVVDKDRDTRISADDYRRAVAENVAWLQFLGPVLPEPDRADAFHRAFSARPYVSNLETAWMEQRQAARAQRERTFSAAATSAAGASAATADHSQAGPPSESESGTARNTPIDSNSAQTGDEHMVSSWQQMTTSPPLTSFIDHRRKGEDHVSTTMPFDWYLF